MSEHNSPSSPAPTPIRAVLLDYGGVLAEEGFQGTLHAVAQRHGLSQDAVYDAAREAIHDTGYLVGKGSEAQFWAELRRHFPAITEGDETLRRELFARFRLQPAMMEAVQRLRAAGLLCAVLSDQTDWLEELDTRDHFFGEFDRVYNSYRVGKSKADASVFDDVAQDLGSKPQETIFVDDKEGHVERARSRGLHGIHFHSVEDCLQRLETLTGVPLGDNHT